MTPAELALELLSAARQKTFSRRERARLTPWASPPDIFPSERRNTVEAPFATVKLALATMWRQAQVTFASDGGHSIQAGLRPNFCEQSGYKLYEILMPRLRIPEGRQVS